MNRSETQQCTHCGAALPADAQFCIECGRAQTAAQAVTGPTRHLRDFAEPEGSVRCANCGTSNPDYARFCVMCGQPFGVVNNADQPLAPPVPASATQTGSFLQGWNLSGAVFLIGLVVLALTDWWWPGIMVVLGITSLVGGYNNGRFERANMQGALWMFGIAVLAITDLWWPGILVLIALSALGGTVARRGRRP